MGQDYSELATRANETGKAFEREMVRACDHYREEAIADIVRCRPASHESPFSIKLAGISQVDFDGDFIMSEGCDAMPNPSTQSIGAPVPSARGPAWSVRAQ